MSNAKERIIFREAVVGASVEPIVRILARQIAVKVCSIRADGAFIRDAVGIAVGTRTGRNVALIGHVIGVGERFCADQVFTRGSTPESRSPIKPLGPWGDNWNVRADGEKFARRNR